MNKSLRNITMTMDKRIKDLAEFKIKLKKRIESMGANIDTGYFERKGFADKICPLDVHIWFHAPELSISLLIF